MKFNRVLISFLFLLVLWTLAGCFKDPQLDSCSTHNDCPDEFPLCNQGLCFVHTLNYSTPLCADDVNDYCCLYADDGTVSKGCYLWQVESSGPHTLALADLDGNRFYTVEGFGSFLEIRAFNRYGDLLWSKELTQAWHSDTSLQQADDGTLVVSTPSGLQRLTPKGRLLDLSPLQWNGYRALLPGVAGEDRILVQTDEELLLLPKGPTADFSTSTTRQGGAPVVWPDEDLAAVVTGEGDFVVLVRLSTLEPLWSPPQQLLPAPMEGMIAIDESHLACLTSDGTLHVLGVDAGLQSPDYWSVESQEERYPNGELLVSQTGQVAFATVQGEICLVDQKTRLNPLCSALRNGFVQNVTVLRNGWQFASGEGEKTRVGFLLDAAHKDLEGMRSLTIDGSFVGATAPNSGGIFLVTTSSGYQAVVSPDIGLTQPWPQPAGAGRSRATR